ncbi:MAG: hypothetical protein AB9907_08315 [Flexilinea sp.]
MEEALFSYPRIVNCSLKKSNKPEKGKETKDINGDSEQNEPEKFRLIIEFSEGEQIRRDVPVSFAERRFSSRRIKTVMQTAPSGFIWEVKDVSIETNT